MKDFIASIGIAGCAIALVVALMFGSGALYVLYTLTIGQAQVDANREVTTRTQQYVDTQNGFLLDLVSEYTKSNDDATKVALANQFCVEQTKLDKDLQVSAVRAFASEHCR